jgi:hypothetical protein
MSVYSIMPMRTGGSGTTGLMRNRSRR